MTDELVRNEASVELTTYKDFGVYAHVVRDGRRSMLLGHDVQVGESVPDAVDAVLSASRTVLLQELGSSAPEPHVKVTLTPELRRLALLHVAETEQGEDEENLTRWFHEQETPDGHVLNATTSLEEAHMVVAIARALLWQHYDREDLPGTPGVDDLDGEVYP